MRNRYDLRVTRYICDRHRCKTPIDVESDTFYEFTGPNDPAFWCPRCEDLPKAVLVGTPATALPSHLPLLNRFTLYPVPRLEPSDDVESANLMYRPYSQRSFLRQYIEWVTLNGVESVCNLRSSATCFKKFDSHEQRYTNGIDYELLDECDGSGCQFLRMETIKPVDVAELRCGVLKLLCTREKPFGMCQTNDEANILRNFLLLTGGDHYPMLIPQPSILSGAKRPDFLCFVPITRFQYHTVVVLIDRPGKPKEATEEEEATYSRLGYTVKRILVDWENVNFSYFKAARMLKNYLQTL